MRSTLSAMAMKGNTLSLARSRSLCARHLYAASCLERAPLAVASIQKPHIPPLLACFQPGAPLFRDCIFPQRASSRTLPHVRHSSSLTGSQPSTDSGDGGKGLPPLNGGGGGGGGGGGDEGAGDQPERVVLPAGKSVDNLPADMQSAFLGGKIPQVYIDRFFSMNANFFLAFLLRFQGLRERLLADPSFLIKLGIECGIGIVTKSAAELNKRGDSFYNELDFVFANVVMAIIADYMLCYLPAPTISFAPQKAVQLNAVQRFFATCPENCFQKVPFGYEPFTMAQRLGAIARNGTKLLGVGFFASLTGVGITNALVALRQMLDPTWVPLNAPQNVLVMSAAYASYMATSSNLRYQVVAGVLEERGVEVLFKTNPALCAALSFVIRTSNTFLGSLMWVDYIRLLGLQPKG